MPQVTHWAPRGDFLDVCATDASKRAHDVERASDVVSSLLNRFRRSHSRSVSPTRVSTGGGGRGGGGAESSMPNLAAAVGAKASDLHKVRSKLLEQSLELERLDRLKASAQHMLDCLGPDASASTTTEDLPQALRAALDDARVRVHTVLNEVDGIEAQAESPRAPSGNDPDRQHAQRNDALRNEIAELHRLVETLSERREALVHEQVSVRSRSAVARHTDVEARVQKLRVELERQKRYQAELRKLQWAQVVSAPVVGLRAVHPFERMKEAIAFLKSTVIHFGQDLRKIRGTLKAATHDKEMVFKRAHNELKTVAGGMLPLESQLAFQTSRDVVWPVTEEMLRTRFPAHKLDACYSALQDMVVSWDAMSEYERERLTTAQDVVANADVLYRMARFIAHEWREKRAAMRTRSFSGGTP